MKKSIVLSVRITDELNSALDTIANKLNISISHLVNSILTSFVFEYSKQLVEHFNIEDEDSENSK